MKSSKLKHLVLVLLAPVILTLTGCSTVISATPAMGANEVPSYWLEVVNGPRESALKKVRATGEALCKGHGYHIAREIEDDQKMSYVLRALVQCKA